VIGHSYCSKSAHESTSAGENVVFCAKAIYKAEAETRKLFASIYKADSGSVWFVANYATLCLRLVVQIKELTLGRKVRQNVVS
jgi:selenocysteine lyase/cysteine desulfurase